MIWWMSTAMAGSAWPVGATAQVTYDVTSVRPQPTGQVIKAHRTITWTETVEAAGEGARVKQSDRKQTAHSVFPEGVGYEAQEVIDDLQTLVGVIELDAKGKFSAVGDLGGFQARVAKLATAPTDDQKAAIKTLTTDKAITHVLQEHWHFMGDAWSQVGAIGDGAQWTGTMLAPFPGSEAMVEMQVIMEDAGEVPCHDGKGAPTCRRLMGRSEPDMTKVKLPPGVAKPPAVVQRSELRLEAESGRVWQVKRVTKGVEAGSETFERSWTWAWK